MPNTPTNIQHHIIVSIVEQLLYLYRGQQLLKTYAIATAKNGIGQIESSECTPLGKHRIAEKIGQDAPENAVFKGRQWHQELYSEALAKREPDRDWILTRILWLEGLKLGLNSGFTENKQGDSVSCDTHSRYIYIHGCPDSHAMQIPSSHGCVKMRNTDMVELFDTVVIDTVVDIQAERLSSALKD